MSSPEPSPHEVSAPTSRSGQAFSAPLVEKLSESVPSIEPTLSTVYCTVTSWPGFRSVSCAGELMEKLVLVYRGNTVGPLATNAGRSFDLDPLAANSTATVDFVVTVPTGAGNEIMSDDTTMTITFKLDQK